MDGANMSNFPYRLLITRRDKFEYYKRRKEIFRRVGVEKAIESYNNYVLTLYAAYTLVGALSRFSHDNPVLFRLGAKHYILDITEDTDATSEQAKNDAECGYTYNTAVYAEFNVCVYDLVSDHSDRLQYCAGEMSAEFAQHDVTLYTGSNEFCWVSCNYLLSAVADQLEKLPDWERYRNDQRQYLTGLGPYTDVYTFLRA